MKLQGFSTIHPQSTNSFFPPSAKVIKASYDFPAQTGNYFLFVNEDYCNLASSLFAVFVKRVSLFTTTHVRKLLFWACAVCIKTRVTARSEPCTLTQFINRCERK